MNIQLNSGRTALATCAIALLTVAGCSSSGDPETGLDVESESLSGVWYYQITNAYDAVFTDCTGDAVVLEGGGRPLPGRR